MVLSHDGGVIAANDAACLAFGLRPEGTIRSMPFGAAACAEFAGRIAEVAAASGDREEIVRLRPVGLDRVVYVHLKAMRGGTSRPRVLAITSEQAWLAEVSGFLSRVFDLTPAEIEVMRLLTIGGTVAGIAQATQRSAGTVRSQIHAILQKTGTRTQAEAVRLAMLLQESVRVEAEPPRAPSAAEPHQRFLRMADGRRVEVLTFGTSAGRPVMWMQSTYGLIRLPRAAEADLTRRGLRVVVPIRAGYGGSDPAPKGQNLLKVAAADTLAVMTQLRIASAPVIAPDDVIRTALMLARAEPARVLHIFGLGSCFPILNDLQYRRLVPIGRFFRACARYQPKVLPFMARAIRVAVHGHGVERYLRGTYARSPADARAFADRETADAVVAGVNYMFAPDGRWEAAFAAELILFHQDWREDLGHVACPVTLIHGEQNGNAPFETALDYCAMYPAWRYIGYPEEGQLLAYVRWRDVFDVVEAAVDFDPRVALPATPVPT